MIGFYEFASTATGLVARAIANVEVKGLENVPREGAFILAPNHLHLADPPVLAAFIPRKIHYMVKLEAWSSPIFGQICRGFEAFPVARGAADLGAYRASLRILSQGRVVGLFPEGHRSRDGRLQAGMPGAVMIARRANVPILPVGIHGVGDAIKHPAIIGRRTLRIVIGEPFYPFKDSTNDAVEETRALMERIARLLPPSARRASRASVADETAVRHD